VTHRTISELRAETAQDKTLEPGRDRLADVAASPSPQELAWSTGPDSADPHAEGWLPASSFDAGAVAALGLAAGPGTW